MLSFSTERRTDRQAGPSSPPVHGIYSNQVALTSFTVHSLVLGISAFTDRSGVGRYADAFVLTRVMALAGIRHIA